jgi:hypothetical protein
MKLFRRGTLVRVQLGDDGTVVAEGRVLVDLGTKTVVVDRHRDPTKLSRIDRERLAPLNPDSRLHCVPTERGWCATQRQARAPTAAEMAGGQWTLCGTWATSRTAPEKREASCAGCRSYAGLEET